MMVRLMFLLQVYTFEISNGVSGTLEKPLNMLQGLVLNWYNTMYSVLYHHWVWLISCKTGCFHWEYTKKVFLTNTMPTYSIKTHSSRQDERGNSISWHEHYYNIWHTWLVYTTTGMSWDCHMTSFPVADLGIFWGGFRFRKLSITVIPPSYSPAGVVNSVL